MGTLHKDQCIFMIISRSVLLRIKNVSDKVVERIKTYILRSITFFPENRAFWIDGKKYGRIGQAIADNTAHAHYMQDT